MPDFSQSTAAAAKFQATLQTYIGLSKKSLDEVLTRKAKSLSIALYVETRKTAPSRSKIKADVERLGWRVRRPKGQEHGYRRGDKKGSQAPMRRMQRAAVARRVRACGFVASGFLPSVQALGGKASSKDTANFKKPRGSCKIALGTNQPSVTITNSTPGILAVERKHRISDAAFKAMTTDTQKYIDRKQADTLKAARA